MAFLSPRATRTSTLMIPSPTARSRVSGWLIVFTSVREVWQLSTRFRYSTPCQCVPVGAVAKNKIKEDANQRLQVTDRKCQRKILLIAVTHDVCLEMFRTLCPVPPELPNTGTSLYKLCNYRYGTSLTTVPVARLQKSLISANDPVVASRKRMLSIQIEFSSHPRCPFAVRFGMAEYR